MSWFKRLSYRGDKEKERADSTSPHPYSTDNASDSLGTGSSSAAPGSSSHGTEHNASTGSSTYPADKKTGMFHDDEPDNDEPPPAYSTVPPGFSAPSAAPASSYPSMYMPVYSIHHIFSPTNNASHGSYNAGNRFCAEHPLAPPLVSGSPESLARIDQGNVTMAPESPHKSISITLNTGPGGSPPTSTIRITKRKCPDSTILSQVPLYLARYHHPSVSNPTVVFGYHLSIINLPLDGDSVIAMGFGCVPYPQYRLPGWHRGSLAIHSDDGRRYCNDGFGGQEFARPILQGENVALGIVYRWVSSEYNPPGRVEAEVVFVRNGRREGGWKVREEPPAGRQDPKIGFLAERDVFAAVGVTGGKGVECVMRAMGRNEAWSVILGEQPPPPSYAV